MTQLNRVELYFSKVIMLRKKYSFAVFKCQFVWGSPGQHLFCLFIFKLKVNSITTKRLLIKHSSQIEALSCID